MFYCEKISTTTESSHIIVASQVKPVYTASKALLSAEGLLHKSKDAQSSTLSPKQSLQNKQLKKKKT